MSVASKPKKNARYDLKAADRKRNLFVQIGLTSIVVLFAAALILYILMSADEKPTAGETKSVRVASNSVITKEGTDEPKAVISLYEDALCPACAAFEQGFGPTLTNITDSGAAAIDYHMVGILNRPQNDNYSSRAGEPPTAWQISRSRRSSGSTRRCMPSSRARRGPAIRTMPS